MAFDAGLLAHLRQQQFGDGKPLTDPRQATLGDLRDLDQLVVDSRPETDRPLC